MATKKAKKKGTVVIIVGIALVLFAILDFLALHVVDNLIISMGSKSGWGVVVDMVSLMIGAYSIRYGYDKIQESGLSTYQTAVADATRTLKSQIANFVIPLLKSKGEVSIHEIAVHVNREVAFTKDFVTGMVNEGYFEDAQLKGGLLVRGSAVPCPYCGQKIPLSSVKCPNCGAGLKK